MTEVQQKDTALTPVRRVSGVKKLVLAAFLFLLVYGADQIIKHVVETTMYVGQSIPVIDGLLWWRYYLNPGAAFSMGENTTWIFTIISTLGALVCAVLIARARSLAWTVWLAVLMGGIVGNLHDRLFREPGFGIGHVVDYISVPNFAIFNLADSAICVSMGVIVLLTFWGIRMDGNREVSAKKIAVQEGE